MQQQRIAFLLLTAVSLMAVVGFVVLLSNNYGSSAGFATMRHGLPLAGEAVRGGLFAEAAQTPKCSEVCFGSEDSLKAHCRKQHGDCWRGCTRGLGAIYCASQCSTGALRCYDNAISALTTCVKHCEGVE